MEVSKFVIKEGDSFFLDASEMDEWCEDWQRIENGDIVKWKWEDKNFIGKAVVFGQPSDRLFKLLVLR